MAALDGTLPLKERSHVAMLIGQHLEFDVAGLLDKLLHVQLAIAEGIGRLAGCRMKEIGQLLRGAHNSHAASAAAGFGLQNDRVAHGLRAFLRLRSRSEHAIGTGQNGHFGLLHRLAGLFLLAHQPGYLGRRTDELDIRGAADLGEAGVLAQQAVAGMNGVDVGNLGGGDDRGHVEIALRQARRANADCLIGKANVQ